RPSPHYRPSLLQIVWGITGQIYRKTVCGAIHVGRSTGCTRRRKTRRGAVDVESSRVVPAAPGATSLLAPNAAVGGGDDGQAVRGCAAADPCPGGRPGEAGGGDGAPGAGPLRGGHARAARRADRHSRPPAPADHPWRRAGAV